MITISDNSKECVHIVCFDWFNIIYFEGWQWKRSNKLYRIKKLIKPLHIHNTIFTRKRFGWTLYQTEMN